MVAQNRSEEFEAVLNEMEKRLGKSSIAKWVSFSKFILVASFL